MIKIVAIIELIIFLIMVAVAFCSCGMLTKQIKVHPGEHYIVEDYGDILNQTSTQLVCEYSFRPTIVMWYSPNNFMGVDSCPLLKQ